MKKTTFRVAAFLSAALISGHLYAQDTKAQADLAGNQPAHTNASATASPGTSLAHEAAASTISVRAIKDFKGRFTKAADERWSLLDKGFCAYFTQDGIKVRAYYDTKGHWQASLRYCNEFQIPHFIRDIVKRTYYDLAITFVNIVEVPEHTVYLVHLEDKNTLKIVRVNEDGEMDVLNDYIKSN
jgi:hypothetical protein